VGGSVTVAVAHDYLTQRGGAERVVLAMLDAFPQAPLYTTLFEPDTTFEEMDPARIHSSPLNRVSLLRRHHRLAFPLLAPTVSRMHIEADVVVCSSSGWAHGVDSTGAKVVYCHAPARWLYQPDAYLRGRGRGARLLATALHERLVRWDQRAASTADRYLVNSTHVAHAVREIYDRDAEVLPPPPAVTPAGPRHTVPGVARDFVLCVSRLLPYKNVDAVVGAFRRLPDANLVVVGDGPDADRLRQLAGPNVSLLGAVDDATLRWLYANAAALVTASYEDYGLTPLEAASFGKPTAALHFGGFLDTLVEGKTGRFFPDPEPDAVAACVQTVLDQHWDSGTLERHAAAFSREHFVGRLREVVAEVGA
jgi:glycosyltransferase involved in cell wall biosynthesis